MTDKLLIHLKDRKQNRLQGYNYSQPGLYFVTICVQNRQELFGEIVGGKMILNEYGKFVQQCWMEITKHFPDAHLDEFVIMPDHIHGIVVIKHLGDIAGNKIFCSLPNNDKMPWQTKLTRSLPSIIRGFKIGVTKHFNENLDYDFRWQKSYYDHIIRGEKSLNNIRAYIRNNPLKWEVERGNDAGLYR